MRTTEPTIALPTRLRASCLATDLVGHAVRITGDKAGGLYQVTRVDIDAVDAQEARAIGVIVVKADTTTCVVQTSGLVSGVWSGLTPGQLMFVRSDATLSNTPPSRPTTGKRTIQALAYAVAADEAVISLGLRVRAIPE